MAWCSTSAMAVESTEMTPPNGLSASWTSGRVAVSRAIAMVRVASWGRLLRRGMQRAREMTVRESRTSMNQ